MPFSRGSFLETSTTRTDAPLAKWNRRLAPFRGPDSIRSARQLAVTATGFVLLWAGMLWSLEVSYALTLLLAIPASGFLARLFMIQHDCGHGSYFRSRSARDAVGFVIGVLTLTPYHYWRRTHAHHHAHSGDLDFRGFGDVDTLTVREYEALPPLKRLGYRLYRHPFVLLGVGALYHFIVKHRFPTDIPRDWEQAWASIWWTNAALLGIVLTAWLTIGLDRFFMVQAPITLITCAAGVWLFYVQHQFEETYWHRHEEWDFVEASIRGSSHLVLPRPLQWITASIGLHHVHHLSARIPNYRLQECLDEIPELRVATRIGILDGWRLFRLTLWDEEDRRLIGFREMRARRVQLA